MEKLKNKNSKNSFLFPSETLKWIWIFATSAMWILWWYKELHLGDIQNTDAFYDALKNEMTFSLKGFIKTIEEQNPEFILKDRQLRVQESIILKSIVTEQAKKKKDGFGNMNFSYILTKSFLKDITWVKESFVYLLIAMYWEWYADVLKDWEDHSDKQLVVEISETENWFRLRELRIEDVKQNPK